MGSPPSELTADLDEDAPVKREKCLMVDPEGDYVMPGRCKKPLDHEGEHDWNATHGAFFGEARRQELQETPSDRLPVRTPGAVLAESEALETERPSGRLPWPRVGRIA